MIISDKGVELIKDFEGYSNKAYLCPAGVWTIGYGSTRIDGRAVDKYDLITPTKALEMLHSELKSVYNTLSNLPVNQHMFDALCSLVYNIGIGAFNKSTLKKRIIQKDFEAAAKEFLRWDKVGGKPMLGLTRRRKAEAALFMSQVG